jgi:UDP-2,3-diacylglucosamine hydrolase
MQEKNNKKIYFASDIHLGHPDIEKARWREKLFVKWLDEIKNDALEIYLLGDIFDFWYEYKKVAPRGFVRLLGKIAELTDAGIPVHFFTGNHDVWIFDYLPSEINIILHRNPIEKELLGKQFYLAHGDGLGTGDWSYKFLKKIFTNKVLQWLFSRLHPNFSLWLAHTWSNSSRNSKGLIASKFHGKDKEILYRYSQQLLQKKHYDYLVFGHRHIMVNIEIGDNGSKFINLGDWLYNFSYGVFDGNNFELHKYNHPENM